MSSPYVKVYKKMKILKEKRKEDSKFKKILMQFKNQLYYESNLSLKKDVRCSSVCLKFHMLYFVLDKYKCTGMYR